jgi:hypothetical protein
LERDLLSPTTAVELRVAAAIEVDEVQSCGGVRREWVGMKWARVFFFLLHVWLNTHGSQRRRR